MDVVLSIGGEVIVYDEGHLLDVNASRQQISGNQDSTGSGTELSHDDIPLVLIHVTMLNNKEENRLETQGLVLDD